MINQEQIIKECQDGNLDEFGVLYDEYFEKIYNFIYYKTHHKESAEDLTSQTFIKALEKIGNYSPNKGLFSSWIYRIARNKVIDYYRTRKSEKDISDVWDLKSDQDIVSDLDTREKLAEVSKYLAKLNPEQREIVVMRVWDSLSYQEISEIIEKSEANCRMIFSRTILEELYLIDEGLREYQTDLEKIVKKLLANKPDVKIDEQFKQELRRELFVQINKIKNQQSVSRNKFMNIFAFNKLSYGLVGAGLSIVLVIAGMYFINQKGYLVGQPEPGLESGFSITSVSDSAFGELGTQAQELGTGVGATGTGGGGEALGTGGMPGVIPIEPVNYRYLYKGEDFVLEQDKVEVLKRVKGRASSGIANLVKNMSFGIVDLSKFSNVQLDTANFVQDKDFGYSLYVNFSDGSISISHNNSKSWRDVFGECYGTGCVRPESLKESDIPSEDKIIEAADNFIREYGINMDAYGEPETMRAQILEQIKTARQGAYISNNIQVVYPLIVNDQYVYEQWGNKAGLNLMINVQLMKVISMHTLRTQNYQASLYQAEQDVSKILEIAEKGGLQQRFFGVAGKTVDVEISAPTSVYLRVWNYREGESDELLVPALLFPVEKTDQNGGLLLENVVVPLAKELLEKAIQ